MSTATETYLAELSQRHITFHDSSKEEKVTLARLVMEAVIRSDWDTVDNWPDESMKTQKISSIDNIYNSLCSLDVLLLGSILQEFFATVIKSNDNDEKTRLPIKQIGNNTSNEHKEL